MSKIVSNTFKASMVRVTRSSQVKTTLSEDLAFGSSFTDHMLTIEWNAAEGWGIPEIKPLANFSLHPAACVFHYGFELFEGLKAFRTDDDKIILFRADRNVERMNKSAARICLPTFEGEELLQLIGKLVEIDKHMVPKRPGYALYIRPVLIGTSVSLGVKSPDKALLYVIASPVGPYFKNGFKAVSLQATDYATRAWPKGVGDKKIGGNYAPCILPQLQAAAEGYDQNLWLFGEENYITEVGTMNVMFVFKDPSTGKKELVTAPLDGTILEGVTRDTILTLCRERLDQTEWTISERPFTMNEVHERATRGELVEAFGCGTAVVVSPIKKIGWNDKTIAVPLLPGEEAGPLTKQVAQWVSDFQYGRAHRDNWSRVVADFTN